MRVAMFSWESLHSISVGGIAQHVTELAAALQRRGIEMHVFTRRGNGQADCEQIFGVHYHRCDSHGSSEDIVSEMEAMSNAMVWAFGMTQARIGPFDVAVAHDWMTCKAMVQCKNSHKMPCIFTFHSTEKGRSGGGGENRIFQVEAEAAFVADRVIAVSGKLQHEIVTHYALPESKVWIVPNGIQCARFDGMLDPGTVKGKYGIGCMDPIVLFVGRMVGGMKGADLLLEAVPAILQAHGQTKVVFVGDGDAKMHCDFRAKELGVSGACRFLGAKGGQELVDLFKACDLVCVPSRNEPFGLVVLEAWSAGKPVVASENVGCPVDHGQNGFVVACTSEGMAWGVKEIFGDFGRARAMGANGRTKAAFSMSWDNVAETTEACYRDVLQWAGKA